MISYKQRIAMLNKYKQEWLENCPTLTNNSGIYILTRTEDEINYAYIGQSIHILQRLAEHLLGYQHIDSSLRKRKIYSENNKGGWSVDFVEYPTYELDRREQEYIKEYAKMGYQLYNDTSGGQIDKKVSESFRVNGYRKGVEYGKNKQLEEIRVYFNKYLDVTIKGKPNKIKEKKLIEFKELLNNNMSDEEI